MSAAVNGAVDFYDTTDPSVAGWGIVGGTSEASPLFSGIVALADQVVAHSLGYLNPSLYAIAERGVPHGIVPISQGGNGYTFCIAAHVKTNSSCASSSDLVSVPGFYANGSYNDATGWGTVDAARPSRDWRRLPRRRQPMGSRVTLSLHCARGGGAGDARAGSPDGSGRGGPRPPPGLPRRPGAGDRDAQGRVRAGSADQGRI